MQITEGNDILLAVRHPDRVSVMLRTRKKDAPHYRCVCRSTGSGYVDFDGYRADNPERVRTALAQLEALEKRGPIDPLRVLRSLGPNEGAEMTLALCVYADFMKFSLQREAELLPVLSRPLAAPFDLRPLRWVYELLLDLDRPELALEQIAGALPLLEEKLAEADKGGSAKGLFKGNAGYVCRMMGDLAERMDRPDLAARALELSRTVAPNAKKLARLVFLYERLEDQDRLKSALGIYEKDFGLTGRMTELSAKIQA